MSPARVSREGFCRAGHPRELPACIPPEACRRCRFVAIWRGACGVCAHAVSRCRAAVALPLPLCVCFSVVVWRVVWRAGSRRARGVSGACACGCCVPLLSPSSPPLLCPAAELTTGAQRAQGARGGRGTSVQPPGTCDVPALLDGALLLRGQMRAPPSARAMFSALCQLTQTELRA